MVATTLSEPIADAIAMSTLIENSGQCTAMRHLCLGDSVTIEKMSTVYDGRTKVLQSPQDAVKASAFDAVLETSSFQLARSEGYSKHRKLPIGLRMNTKALPVNIDEKWRNVYLDITSDLNLESDVDLSSICSWLNDKQPISLAVNGEKHPYELFRKLFEGTGLVVYTIGSNEQPALTCQARPQEAEVFGEFPPRWKQAMYTKFPMIVPSPTASYNSFYTHSYLQQSAQRGFGDLPNSVTSLLQLLNSPLERGYARVLVDYLLDALRENPKRGGGSPTSRTCLYGLQRPPTNQCLVVRTNDLASAVLHTLTFALTTAHDALIISTGMGSVSFQLKQAGLRNVKFEANEVFEHLLHENKPWGVVRAGSMDEYPLASQFVSTLLPLGHAKSTKTNDTEFFKRLGVSSKWLQLRSRSSHL